MYYAYSLELNDVIDSDKAYEFYWNGLITDKKSFECPSPNCEAQVTCANIDKLVTEMKQSVHFRIIGDHSEQCVITAKAAITNSGTLTKKDKKVDNFLLTRPANYFDKSNQASKLTREIKQQVKTKLVKSIKSENKTKNYYSIRSIVNNYIKLISANKDVSSYFINIKGKEISYKDFFIKINEINFEDAPDHPRIYYHAAFVNTTKKGNVQFRFSKGFKDNLDGYYKTSVFLNLEKLSGYSNFDYWNKKIDKVLDSKKPETMLYIYGKPQIYQGFVNFHLYKFDFIEMKFL